MKNIIKPDLKSRSVFFYPHAYLRDRQLDTIRFWDRARIVNPELLQKRVGAQVSRKDSLAKETRISWKQRLPLINIKRRPPGIPDSSAVYVWGGIMASGDFVSDIDNPYCYTGYNVAAMSLYRPILRRILASDRCIEIRCMSEACLKTLRILFGDEVAGKASVHYPRLEKKVGAPPRLQAEETRFLFIGTQFEIKGGPALIRAFKRLALANPATTLDLVTHLPETLKGSVAECPNIRVHAANLSREEIFERFMKHSHVLVHPTYVESFGMVVLEALAHGMALIATDIYALEELVEDGVNGFLIPSPISMWNGFIPSRHYRHWQRYKSCVSRTDTTAFEDELFERMRELVSNPLRVEKAREASLKLFERRFLREGT